MGTMNTMNGNNMRLHQLTQNQTRNQPQNAANNIANVNHIQNKYNTTIINLNGSLNGNLNGLMDSVVQMNGEVDNQCVVPYPSNGQHHGAQNNINMIRARARSNAAVPMSASLTKRGSIMAGKYKILSVLADGTFSRTVCAQDIKTLRLVAIKIMKDKCQYVGVQEAKRLAFFNSKDAEDLCHVVRFVETIHYQTRFCLVLEILGISLFKYLQINQFATLNVVRKVAIQLMISMQFVHSFNQIHADLKPENVLLVKESTTQRKAIRSSKNCKIKVIDFGNSISLAESEAYFDKFEIQSLYYRAPEVVLGCRFGCAIDIWSCGCILMELVLGAPLFATHNKSALCHKIHSVLGPFPIHAYQNAKFYKEYFNKPSYITHQSVYSELYTQRYEGIDKILKSKYNQMGHEWTIDHDYFVQFIACLLDLDPKTRMKASDAFFHPFLQKLFPFRAVFDHKKQSKDSELNAQDITLGQNDHEHDTVSLSNIDLSDSDALQKHKNLICNKQRFGAECTKLPSNFRNPLIHQLQPHPHAITHTHQCQSHHHHHPAAAAAMPQPQPHHQQQQQQQHMQQQMNQHQQQQQMHSMQQQQQQHLMMQQHMQQQQQQQQYYATYRSTTAQQNTNNNAVTQQQQQQQQQQQTTQYVTANYPQYAAYGQYVSTTPTGYVAIQQQQPNTSYVMDNRTGSIYAAIPATGHYQQSVYPQTQYVSIPQTAAIAQHIVQGANGQSAVVLTQPQSNNNNTNTPQPVTVNTNNSNTMSTPPNVSVADTKIQNNNETQTNNSMHLPVLNNANDTTKKKEMES
eukprot:697161_1